jgi:hypothetical protein
MNDQDLQLLDAWRHDRITASEFEVLQARLKTDAKLRAELRTLAEIEEGLSGLALVSVHDPSMATGGEPLPTPDSNRSSWLPWSIAAVACMAAVMAMIALLWPDVARRRKPHSEVVDDKSATREPASVTSFGQLVRTSAVLWGDVTFQPGDRVKAGRVRLVDGTAEFNFNNGVRMVLSGPAEIELRDAMHAWLHSGKVMFRVPPAAAGFTLETKEAEIVDLGTVFGVEAGSQGGCLMQVYEGEVMASAKLDAEETAPRRVLQGEAVRVNGAVYKTDFWPDRFVRLLPGPEDPAGRGNHPYNVSQFDSVRIVSAPADISIDGDLSDWNLAGRFRSSCEAPFAEDYYLEAAMMYDERQLYVGAHVGDPFPMRSQIRPIDAENQHGAGGAVALRLSTDRQAGWPLSATANGERNGRPASPADLSDKLSFVVLWFYEPEQKACIHLRHGMDLHGLKVNPPGYQGAYRKDVDGRGYTLEYAIPWNLLNAADDPPRAGDELAAMWLVHWSDPAGRKWQGQLIDVTKPNEPGWNFLRAATWGKAIYVRNP